LQQGLQLEADRGFGNLQGRREPFQAFLSRSLGQVPIPLPAHQQQLLDQLAEQFAGYEALNQSRRQSLVRRTRQALHELQRAHEPVRPPAPPRLRLVADAPAPVPSVGRIDPETPLSEI
jgi:ATP-dependent DNA helicase RecG